jgi:hypothetical protein
MIKFSKQTVERWKAQASKWLADAGDPGTADDVYLGAEAWQIAHRCGIVNEAYQSPAVVDAHIVTALKQIFPNAEFRDKYRY